MTPVERRVLDFMAGYVEEHGLPPTLAEISAHIGVSARSRVHRLLAFQLLPDSMPEPVPALPRSMHGAPLFDAMDAA